MLDAAAIVLGHGKRQPVEEDRLQDSKHSAAAESVVGAAACAEAAEERSQSSKGCVAHMAVVRSAAARCQECSSAMAAVGLEKRSLEVGN